MTSFVGSPKPEIRWATCETRNLLGVHFNRRDALNTSRRTMARSVWSASGLPALSEYEARARVQKRRQAERTPYASRRIPQAACRFDPCNTRILRGFLPFQLVRDFGFIGAARFSHDG